MKFNLESSIETFEVIRIRFPCPGLLDFLRNLFKNLKYGRSIDSDAINLNFSKELDSTNCSVWVLERLDF